MERLHEESFTLLQHIQEGKRDMLTVGRDAALGIRLVQGQGDASLGAEGTRIRVLASGGGCLAPLRDRLDSDHGGAVRTSESLVERGGKEKLLRRRRRDDDCCGEKEC